MSKIGRIAIIIPDGVEVELEGTVCKVKGPKGELSCPLNPMMSVEMAGKEIKVKPKEGADLDVKEEKSLWGLQRVMIASLIEGVSKGYEKVLEIEGVGFRAKTEGKKLVLNIGFSHPVDYYPLTGVEVKVQGEKIKISGIDKQLVGETAAQIRDLKKPEPYKGKGIRYAGEVIRRKVGKKAAGETQ